MNICDDIHRIGLAPSASPDIQARFAKWAGSEKPVHASREEAIAACPRAFESVCSQWRRAGTVYRKYPLADGRIAVAEGIWWEVPEPGGSVVVLYLESRAEEGKP